MTEKKPKNTENVTEKALHYQLLREPKLLMSIAVSLRSENPSTSVPVGEGDDIIHISINTTTFIEGKIVENTQSIDKKYINSSIKEVLILWTNL